MIQMCLSPAVGVFLAFFTPTLAYVGLNTSFFTKKQIRNSLFVSAFVGLLLAIATALAHIFLARYGASAAMGARLGTGVLITCLLCVLNEQTLQNLFPRKQARCIFIAVLGAIMLTAAFFTLMLLNGLLLCILSLHCVIWPATFPRPKYCCSAITSQVGFRLPVMPPPSLLPKNQTYMSFLWKPSTRNKLFRPCMLQMRAG